MATRAGPLCGHVGTMRGHTCPVRARRAAMGGSAAPDNARFIDQLRSIVGLRHVLTKPESTLRYRTGVRCGSGPALAVVKPGNLVERWRVLEACVAANKIIIMQAANTGLTGGSTPDG